MMRTQIEEVYTIPKNNKEYNHLWNTCDNLGFKTSNYRFDGIGILVQYNANSNNIDQFADEPELQAVIVKSDVKELSVKEFVELLTDKLYVPWRLEEYGFIIVDQYYELTLSEGCSIIVENGNRASVIIEYFVKPLTLKTFTELIQQMKFLGWESN